MANAIRLIMPCLLAAMFMVAAPCPTLAKALDPNNFEVSGTVTNVTVGKSTGVTMKITREGDEYRAVGQYDSKNLFGKFDVPGRLLSGDEKHSCLQFSGDIAFGDDGSGFPAGTKTEYVMSLFFTKKEVVGTYHIKRLDGYSYDQYGTMKLSSRHVVPVLAKRMRDDRLRISSK